MAGERRDYDGDQRFQPSACVNTDSHTNSWESTLTHTHPNILTYPVVSGKQTKGTQ